jgi:hypothetical protein
MKKVMCIWDDWIDFPTLKDSVVFPEFGKIYTVKNAFDEDNILWYELAEFPQDAFEQSGFVDLSEIDETTFERQSLYQQNLK